MTTPQGGSAPVADSSVLDPPSEGPQSVRPATDGRAATDPPVASKKRKNHRGGKKRRARRQPYLPSQGQASGDPSGQNLDESRETTTKRPSLYRLGHSGGRNLSETSLDSNALLDHRDHQPMRQRRESRVLPSHLGRGGQSNHDLPSTHRSMRPARHESNDGRYPRQNHARVSSGDESEADDVFVTDRTPLIGPNQPVGASPSYKPAYGLFAAHGRSDRRSSYRRASTTTSTSSKYRIKAPSHNSSYDVNNPPSVPNSPKLGVNEPLEDVMATAAYGRSPENTRNDQFISIDNDFTQDIYPNSAPPSPRDNPYEHRRHTIATGPEEDVCFPIEGMSAIGEEDSMNPDLASTEEPGTRRRRFKQWPDLSVLDEWSTLEKESRSEGIRTKKINEPMLVNGRLRPQQHGWHRAEEDAPYRFTYFNEEMPSTIHSQTISELLQPGQEFRELFIPDPPVLSDESSGEEDTLSVQGLAEGRNGVSPQARSRLGTRHSSLIGDTKSQTRDDSGEATPRSNAQGTQEKPKRLGDRPPFWLDVLSPTDAELRVLGRAFGIHALTTEDISMREDREKVELFPHYYFVNYRSFEQDRNSDDYLDPVNIYIVVFREGLISFRFSMSPHPANVRRRIRTLNKSLIIGADFISYAIIDDITDVFQPIIQEIQEEVDDIDDSILALHDNNKNESDQQRAKGAKQRSFDEKSEAGANASRGSDMLRRVGEGRKTVMRVQRLLGNKADVIKSFAKRCNERWEVAPKSDIGLFLGDVQDHVVTMTSNLSHYETLLSRAHSNYLAQINIRMNERQEKTADVLGKLTVLGTIVLPMNIITGMWGMNVLVPGQDVESLYWFWSITAGLVVFGVSCFFIAKRVYGIV